MQRDRAVPSRWERLFWERYKNIDGISNLVNENLGKLLESVQLIDIDL